MYRNLTTARRLLIVAFAAVMVFSFVSPITVRAVDFIPELDIPGQFEGPQPSDGNLFGRYVRAIYIYFIWIVGIVATAMITFAGVKWVAAAGDQGRIRDARDMISNAIIGVIIALTSVVLLNLLSPGFTTLSIPGVKDVKPIPFVINPETGCIDTLTCPSGTSRTYAIYCAGSAYPAGGGTALYVDADIPFCANNGLHRGICCRNTETNKCIGISATDGKSFTADCNPNAAATIRETTTTSCTDSTPCGQKISLPNNKQCIGTFCPTGELCADKNGSTPARCLNPAAETGALLRVEISAEGICKLPGGAKRFYEYYTSGAACGKSVTAYDTVLKQQVQAFGTGGGCKPSEYCGTAPIGADASNNCLVIAPRTICKPTSLYPR